jgi:hypothetical protein
MRRILLGGLGIALGAFTSPAFAQQPSPTTSPPRGAAFGKPSAVPDPAPSAPAAPAAPSESEVTPAGLFRNTPLRPTVVRAPGSFGTPVPVITQPPGATVSTPGVSVVPSTVPGGMPVVQPGTGIPIAPPRPVVGAPPSVTETRDPTGRIPGGFVPSVSPDGFDCSDLGLEQPLFDGRPRGFDRIRGLGGKTWVSAELLMWWNRSTQVPALVTTSSPQFNGIPGQGDTRVLLGGSFGDTYHVGGRIGVGHWFGDGECRGVDARLFWVAPASDTFVASVPPFGLLARPFFNVNPTVTTPGVGFGPSAEVVAGPGVATGNVVATMKSTVWGTDVNYRRYLLGDACARVDALVGYRYLDLREDLTINETFVRTPGSDPTIGIPAMSGIIADRFRTTNTFHGGQIGLAASVNRGRWSLDYRGTVAFGTVFQSADISGSQTLAFADGTVGVVPGGLLAVPGTNIGHFTQSRFAVVPEIGVNLGYQLTTRMKVFVGYNFLYLSSAVRPGEVIDTRIDAARVPNLLPPGSGTAVLPRPAPLLSTSGYYIQGINFGLVYKW